MSIVFYILYKVGDFGHYFLLSSSCIKALTEV